MSTASKYLEAVKIDGIAAQLARQGYSVDAPLPSDNGYDLIAAKNGRRIAVEVKARETLAVREVEQLRTRAHQQGFDEFRLVVVDPPHETAVEIEGLEDLLFGYMSENVPAELDELSTSTRVANVGSIGIDSITVTGSGIHIVGDGVVEVELEYGGGEQRDGLTSTMDFPLRFDILLSHDLTITDVYGITADTSSFYE